MYVCTYVRVCVCVRVHWFLFVSLRVCKFTHPVSLRVCNVDIVHTQEAATWNPFTTPAHLKEGALGIDECPWKYVHLVEPGKTRALSLHDVSVVALVNLGARLYDLQVVV